MKLLTLLALMTSLTAHAANTYSLREDGVRGTIWTNNGDGNWLFSYPTIGLSTAGWVPLALNPDGTIGISASFSGAVDQGAPGTEPWPVSLTPQTSTTATITNVSVTAGVSEILLNTNTNRKGFKIFDQDATQCYVAMTSTASPTLFSVILMPFGITNSDGTVYQGPISAYCSGSGNILVTEY